MGLIHTLCPAPGPIGARSVFGEDAHGVYVMGWRATLKSPESRARSRQRKQQSFLVDVAEEGCPPLHLWFHRHGIRQLWAGTIEKKILSLLDIRRFLPLFILPSYSLKPAVWQLSQSVCIVLGMFHKDEPTCRRMDVGHTQIVLCL